MFIAGIVLLILQAVGLIGAAIAGQNPFNGGFFGTIGYFLFGIIGTVLLFVGLRANNRNSENSKDNKSLNQPNLTTKKTNNNYDLYGVLNICQEIEHEAKSMELKEFIDLSKRQGYLEFIKNKPEFYNWLKTLSKHNYSEIVGMIIHQISQIFKERTQETILPHTRNLLRELNDAAKKLNNAQISCLVDMANSPDIFLCQEE